MHTYYFDGILKIICNIYIYIFFRNENLNNAASDEENVSNNAMGMSEVAPFSDEGNVSCSKMELDESPSVSGKESVLNSELELNEDTSVSGDKREGSK